MTCFSSSGITTNYYLDYVKIVPAPIFAPGVSITNNDISAAFPLSKLAVSSTLADASASVITLERPVVTGLIGGVRFGSGYINPGNATPFWSGIDAYGTGGADQMDLRFYTTYGGSQQNLERMRIDPLGNIFIGTPTSGKVIIGTTDMGKVGAYSLAVNGSAIFTKAVVRSYVNWADYVFEPDYNLISLKELEAFILKNKHLPEVPSAVEINNNGIDLGDNQTILLKKVEELTLYLIDLNKKVEALSNENGLLKKQVNEIRQ